MAHFGVTNENVQRIENMSENAVTNDAIEVSEAIKSRNV